MTVTNVPTWPDKNWLTRKRKLNNKTKQQQKQHIPPFTSSPPPQPYMCLWLKTNLVFLCLSTVLPLVEITAKTVALHIPFEEVEKVYPPVPENLQLRIAYWSFPENEEDIRWVHILRLFLWNSIHRKWQNTIWGLWNRSCQCDIRVPTRLRMRSFLLSLPRWCATEELHGPLWLAHNWVRNVWICILRDVVPTRWLLREKDWRPLSERNLVAVCDHPADWAERTDMNVNCAFLQLVAKLFQYRK